MTEPTSNDPGLPDFSGLEGHGGDEAVASEVIGLVVAWYSAQVMAEHRVPVPDEERLEALKAAQRAAIADRQRLFDCEPAEIARLTADYAARLEGLQNP
ncbi:hypothetical protein [Streptomyces sp. NPDC056387]|uniref:hypothetical protein n=1 Tax=Streptomyces sp. NPDC056387 TaxID=3345803 RepID=UPI0035DB22C2